MKKHKPSTKEELKNLVFTDGIKLSDVDTSLITDMSELFQKSQRKDFEGIEDWDTSNVKNMSWMFRECFSFNQPLDKWDTSNVINMKGMFSLAKSFNQNINNWNVSKVVDMSYMFNACDSFNQPLNDWDVSNVKTMEAMFHSALSFNQPLDKWNTSKVENMHEMFCRCKQFNQPLNSWDVSNVKTMESMFYSADSFNQPLDKWNTKKLSKMYSMFKYTDSYNCYDSLANWDLSKVSDISDFCANYERFYEKLPLRLRVYMQAFYGPHKVYVPIENNEEYDDDEYDFISEEYDLVSRDYITITKENVREVYNAISKDTNKKVMALKKKLETEYSKELSSVTDDYNFKTIEEAEKYVENNYNKKDDKKVSFINDNYKVLIKDKSREVENKVLKYIYLEYLVLKRDIKILTQVDNIVNLLDKESFIKFIKNIYNETNKETAAFIYGIYGGDEAVKNIYKKEKDSKLSLLIIKLNIESKYALRILHEIYSNTKKSEVRYEAYNLIDEVIKKMNISYNEFELRFSPDFSFNSKGEKVLNEDYKLILNSDYSLSLFDIKNNKELKKAPQNLPEDLKDEITKLRKEIPSFMKNTSSLLAVLLASGEKYSYDIFKDIFINNAIMNRFASSLIWNLYNKDYNFVTTFRYSGDGSYSNCEDEEVKIDDNGFVSLASPIEMDDDTINKWRKQLEDYEIAQPLQQLTIIKLDKDNLKSELEKIDNSEIAYGTFKAFGARYGMYTEYVGYDVVSSYSLKSKNGDTFSIYANVNSNTDFHDRVKIDIYFTNENGEEVSKRFIYTLLVLMIWDFRLTDLF
ncbi:BspA family leucine-rich repeat surface protein [Brachyspira alvinipulli]|uniref:BspA family leucine-rich repeat surface protein n=1 Tax=Brachyspira alvinipulli TaxID=84379 RepID=UPI00300574A8